MVLAASPVWLILDVQASKLIVLGSTGTFEVFYWMGVVFDMLIQQPCRKDFEDIWRNDKTKKREEEERVESKKQKTNSQGHFGTNTRVCAEVTMRQQEEQEERAP